MSRFIIPLIAVVLFYLEPVFSLFSPVTIGQNEYTLVPRLVIVFLIFITVYYSRKQAIIYGIVFGLLYDMYHIDIIGVYTFLYPVICYLTAFIIRQVHRHILTVMALSIVMIALVEIFSYLFASLISLTTIGFDDFLSSRLLPTLIANSIFVGMFGYLFKQLFDKSGEQLAGI
ncbi:rod shape-determining protein MreD [Sporosarcina sp. Sa2YVA2]|uniref:Rod shape-determining protein MreD n=1 Tax=Sporosarcina quadrami TaxID=2762234 RepID=A0ABR8U4R8_9BACL|nr:rod shape-determining protein MreD [Sporosarcina quadrami]MBD7983037.1 rod shape-determining protein MreD [Sporosarcina quadrami]